MNKLEKESKNRLPDADDEQFWDDFSRELWFMFKRAEDAPDLTAEKPAASSRENCLTFDRCAEIGRKRFAPNESEKAHLRDCRFCARRVEKYAALPPLETAAPETIEAAPVGEPARKKKSWWEGIFGNAEGFGGFAGKLAFAGFTLLVVLGAGIIALLLLNSDRSGERLATISDANSPAPNYETLSNPPTDAATITDANEQSAANAETKNANKMVNAKTAAPDANAARQTAEPPLELAFLPDDEREAVNESIEAGRIRISEVVKKLREDPLVRGDDAYAPQIAPKNEAVLESQPLLTWRGDADSEYQIVVLDVGFNEVAKSEVVTKNKWRINKNLAPKFYFWQVTIRKKGASVFNTDGEKAYFKIVAPAEKARIERAKAVNKSRLAAAVLYARAGLFREAERELEAEIKNTSSVKARKMLTQVRRWRSR